MKQYIPILTPFFYSIFLCFYSINDEYEISISFYYFLPICFLLTSFGPIGLIVRIKQLEELVQKQTEEIEGQDSVESPQSE